MALCPSAFVSVRLLWQARLVYLRVIESILFSFCLSLDFSRCVHSSVSLTSPCMSTSIKGHVQREKDTFGEVRRRINIVPNGTDECHSICVTALSALDVSKVSSGFEYFLLIFAPESVLALCWVVSGAKFNSASNGASLDRGCRTGPGGEVLEFWKFGSIKTIEILATTILDAPSANPYPLALMKQLESLESLNYWYSWNPWTIDILGTIEILELLIFLESLNY